MKRNIVILLLTLLTASVALVSCDKASARMNEREVEKILDEVPALYADEGFSGGIRLFMFTKKGNQGSLMGDVECSISDESRIIALKVPPGRNLGELTPTFTTRNCDLYWGDEKLASGKTMIDLSVSQILTAKDRNGKTAEYFLFVQTVNNGLPVVVIETESGKIPSDKTPVKGTVAISGGTTAYSSPLSAVHMLISLRGQSSASDRAPKKSYKIELLKSGGLLDMPKGSDWVLVANYFDRSLMRNYLGYNTARIFGNMEYSPRMRYVDLFVDDVYMGNYLLGEHRKVNANRINIEKHSAEEDTGYLLEINSRSPDLGKRQNIDYFATSMGLIIDFKTPHRDVITNKQRNFIKDYVKKTEQAIFEDGNYEDYIDVPSFVDWLLVEEIFKNMDSAFHLSCFITKPAGGKLRMGPVWDFDLSCGNSNYGTAGRYTIASPKGWYTADSVWYKKLLTYDEFYAAFKARWNEMRDYSKEYIFKLIDDTAAMIDRSQEENFNRWPIMGTYVWPSPDNLIKADTYEKQIDELKKWLEERYDWLDKEINKK